MCHVNGMGISQLLADFRVFRLRLHGESQLQFTVMKDESAPRGSGVSHAYLYMGEDK